MITRIRAVLIGPLLVALVSCRGDTPALELVAPASSPREEYIRTLEDAGLGGSALLRDWTNAAMTVLTNAPLVPAAFRETAVIDVAGLAHAYRVSARRGQRVRVQVHVDTDVPTRVFIDAFAAATPPRLPERALGQADGNGVAFAVEPDFDGEVLVRVQPELLRSGRVTVTIELEHTLGFPVTGHGLPDVGSVFGDARDAGSRSHHGIDIFAPRGTPVIAAAAGTVMRVSETPRGGRVVWMSVDQRRARLYYAHLDTQLVSGGTRVEQGDTLGLVGNTGNARTTPPHLHFGIYSRGPVDPLPFLRPIRARVPAIARDTGLVGRWIRTAGDETVLRREPDSNAVVLSELPRSTAMRVLAAGGDWLRVYLPDGTFGFVPARAAEDANAPLRNTVLAGRVSILAQPDSLAPVIDTLNAGESLAVHGRFRDYYLVRVRDIPVGWIAADEDSDQ
jgi:hypothetical protein